MDLRDRAVVERLIRDRHWDRGESIRAIERSLGLGKTVLSNWCRRHGIAVRPRVAQAAITNRDNPNRVRGERHWAYGRRKETDAWAARHSERMRGRNPMSDLATLTRRNEAWAATMRRQPTYAEAALIGMFEAARVPFVFQYPHGRYIIDFAFPAYRVALEIDGKNHGSRGRQAHDGPRDRRLVEEGWKVLRVRQENLARPARLLAVLKQYVPDVQIPSGLPSDGRQYRVLVRDAECPAGRKA